MSSAGPHRMVAPSFRVCRLLVATLAVLAGCFDASTPVAVGTLERDRIDLVAEASEPVVERAVEEGAFVEAGALIVRLDPSRFEAQLAQQVALRDAARARLAELVRGPRTERIAEARARLRGAEGLLATAQSDLDRARELAERGIVSKQIIDERRARFDESLAGRDSALAALEALLDGTTVEEIDQAEAALEQAEAGLVDVRIRLERLTLRAPSTGFVDALPYQLGERPPPSGVVAVMLAGGAPYARVYVPAEIRAEVVPGTPAHVVVDGIDTPFEGAVRHVSKDASFTPYFALTERDRGRLVYVAKVDLHGDRARSLPSGLPVVVSFGGGSTAELGAADDHGPR